MVRFSNSRLSIGQQFSSGRAPWQGRASIATDPAAAVGGGTSLSLWEVDSVSAPAQLVGSGALFLPSGALTAEPFAVYRENLRGAYSLGCLGYQDGGFELGISTPSSWDSIVGARGPLKACASPDDPTQIAVWSPDIADSIALFTVDLSPGGGVGQTSVVKLPPGSNQDVRGVALSRDLLAVVYSVGVNAATDTIVANDLATNSWTTVATDVRGTKVAASGAHLVWSAEFTHRLRLSTGVELYYWTPGPSAADQLFARGLQPSVDLTYPSTAGDILAFTAALRIPTVPRARRKTALFLIRLTDLLAGNRRAHEVTDNVVWNDHVAPYAIAPGLHQPGIAVAYLAKPATAGEPHCPHLTHLRVV